MQWYFKISLHGFLLHVIILHKMKVDEVFMLKNVDLPDLLTTCLLGTETESLVEHKIPKSEFRYGRFRNLLSI